MNIRSEILRATKAASESDSEVEHATLLLMNAAIRERDIEARSHDDNEEGISDDAILSVLSRMVEQREESAQTFKKRRKPELAQRELDEISVISRFLPKPLSAEEIDQAIDDAITDCEACTIKDIGKIKALLKERHHGRMEFTELSARIKKRLDG